MTPIDPQLAAVIVIIAAAILYIVVKTIGRHRSGCTPSDDTCRDCPLKKNCEKKSG